MPAYTPRTVDLDQVNDRNTIDTRHVKETDGEYDAVVPTFPLRLKTPAGSVTRTITFLAAASAIRSAPRRSSAETPV